MAIGIAIGHRKADGKPRITYKPIEANGRDYKAVFAVPDNERWWLAVHAVINQAEQETIESARKRIGNTNQCIGDVGAGEGIALVRTKLIEARQAALSVRR